MKRVARFPEATEVCGLCFIIEKNFDTLHFTCGIY